MWLLLSIEICPIEATFAAVALRAGDASGFFLKRSICLAIVLGPLLCYLWLNGKAGIKHAWGQITFILVVLGLKLPLEIWAALAALNR